jgi:hypothetical protein
MSLIVALLLVSVVFLIAMVILIVTAAASVMGREQPLKQYEPTCGGCHYIVKDLEARTCEICGAEFTNVGINMPPAQMLSTNAAIWAAFRQVSLVPISIWTAIVGFIAVLVIVPVGERFWPFSSHLESRIDIRPKSGGWDTLSISGVHDRHARGRMQQDYPTSLKKEIQLELKTPTGRSTLTADFLKPTLTYTDPAGNTITKIVVPTSGYIADFMRAAGIHTKQAAHESPYISELFTKATETPEPSPEDGSTPTDTSSSDSPLDVYNINITGGHWQQATSLAGVGAPAVGGLWLVGVVAIFIKQHGRRRTMRERLLNPPTNDVDWQPPEEPFVAPNETGPASSPEPRLAPKADPGKGPNNSKAA